MMQLFFFFSFHVVNADDEDFEDGNVGAGMNFSTGIDKLDGITVSGTSYRVPAKQYTK